jgi:hypothetical protein
MRLITSLLLLGFLWMPIAGAEPPASVQTEVNSLLGDIGSSGCAFYRNGTWHDSKEAEAHLRDKYNWLSARDMIKTPDDFIDLAGTKSSLSGVSYAVRCNGEPAVPSNQWLREELLYLHSHGHFKGELVK